MKYVKILGLAAVTAMAMMAFVGAGSASASELCTETVPAGSDCPAAKQITTIEASQVGSGQLETLEGTTLVTCTGGDLHLSVTSQGTGKPVVATVNTILFTGCTSTVDTITTGTVEGAKVSESSGSITSKGAEVTTGILGTTCTYGTGTGTALGNTNGTSLTVSTIVKKTAGSFLCPGETRWTASFKITNHNAVWWN